MCLRIRVQLVNCIVTSIYVHICTKPGNTSPPEWEEVHIFLRTEMSLITSYQRTPVFCCENVGCKYLMIHLLASECGETSDHRPECAPGPPGQEGPCRCCCGLCNRLWENGHSTRHCGWQDAFINYGHMSDHHQLTSHSEQEDIQRSLIAR